MVVATVKQGDEALRRTDLDWVRIVAFAILILYHIGMFYGPADWVVKSPRVLPWLQIPMDWSSPFRLLLLFIVSGAATRFIGDKMSRGALLKSRSLRLLPPLLFAVVFVVPIEFYYQAVARLRYQGGFIDFWGHYLNAQTDFCTQGPCPFLPSWDYLWFVAYLWIYTVLLVGMLACFPGAVGRLQRTGQRILSGGGLLAVPALVMILARLVLRHYWPETHALLDDWYLHFIYFFCFAFGFLFATSEQVWSGFAARRHVMLAVGVIAYAFYAFYAWHYRAAHHVAFDQRVFMVVDYGIDQWAWVATAFGFAHRYLAGRDGPRRRYLTDAIFPYYIVHQTLIVVVAYRLAKLHWPLGVEAAMVVAATVVGCGVTYEVVHRVAWLRPWFGLKRPPPHAGAVTASDAAGPANLSLSS